MEQGQDPIKGPGGKLSPAQFAEKVRKKYGAYQDVDDVTLTKKMLEKYPEYRDVVDISIEPKKEPSVSSASKSKYRLPQDEAEAQRAGRVAPPSELARKRVQAPDKDLYDMPTNQAKPVTPPAASKKTTSKVLRLPGSDLKINLDATPDKSEGIYTQAEKTKKLKTSLGQGFERKVLLVPDKSGNLVQKTVQVPALVKLTDEEKKAYKDEQDLDLPHPYLYYSSTNPNSPNHDPEDNFTDAVFGNDNLEAMGIDPSDLDGYMNKEGYKDDYLTKEEKGLFQENPINEEAQRQRILAGYLENRVRRNLTRKEVDQDKDSPSVDFNKDNVKTYVQKSMPELSKRIAQSKEEARKEYRAGLESKGSFWSLNNLKHIATSADNAFYDRIGNISATVYDKLGFDGVADDIRYQHDIDQMLRPSNPYYQYAEGNVSRYKGKNYIVSEDGDVYDVDNKLKVTNFLDRSEIEAIKRNKTDETDWSFSSKGSAQGVAGVMTDLLVQIAAQQATSNLLGPGAAFEVRGMQLSRPMASSIIAQSALGYSSGMEQTLTSLRNAGITDKKALPLANEAARNTALLYALTAPLSPQTKATEAIFGTEVKQLIKSAARVYQAEGEQASLDVIRKGFAILAKRGVEMGEEGFKEAFQENVQQLGEAEINQGINTAIGRQVLDDRITMEDFVNTTITSIMTAGIASQMRVSDFAKSKNSHVSDLFQLSQDPIGFDKSLKELTANGTINDEVATQLRRNVELVGRHVNSLPSDINPAVSMDIMEKLDEIRELEQEKKRTDKAFHEKIDQQIETKRTELNEIYKNQNTSQPESSPELAEGKNTQTVEPKTSQAEETVNNEQKPTSTPEADPTAEGVLGTDQSGVPLSNDGDVRSDDEQAQDDGAVTPEEDLDVEDQLDSVDLSSDLGINKALSILEDLDQRITNYGKENLSMGIPVVVAQGAVKAMKAAVKTAKTTTDIISAGLNHIRQTDWYKSLDTDQQNQVEGNYWLKQINKQLGKGGNTKQNVHNVVGMTDTSEKVTYTKRDLLKHQLKIEEAAARQAYSFGRDEQLNKSMLKQMRLNLEAMAAKGRMNVKTVHRLVAAAARLDMANPEAVNRFYNQYAKAMVQARYNAKAVNRKVVKSRIRKLFNRFGAEKVKVIAGIEFGNIPAHLFNEYVGVVEMLSDKDFQNIDWSRANALSEQLQPFYTDQVAEKYDKKKADPKPATQGQVDAHQDKIDQIEFLQMEVQESDSFTEYENATIRRFKAIPIEWIAQNVKPGQLTRLIKTLKAAHYEPWLANKTLGVINDKYIGWQNAQSIQESVGDKTIGVSRNLFQRIFGIRKSTKEGMLGAIKDSMLQHVDLAFTQIKGTPFYDNLIHPLTSNFNKANEETNQIDRKLSSLVATAKASVQGSRLSRLFRSAVSDAGITKGVNYEYRLNVLLQLYFRQMEWDANKAMYMGTKVHNIADHVAATLDQASAIGLSKESADVIESLYEQYKTPDGEIDTAAIERDLTSAEKAVVSFIRQELDIMQSRSREVNDHRKGESLDYMEHYFPRKAAGSAASADLDESSLNIRLNAVLGSTSTKAGASNSRITNTATALDFNTLGNFMQHVQEGNVEYNLSHVVKQAGITITELSKSSDESMKAFAAAMDTSIKNLLKYQLGPGVYVDNSNSSKAFRVLVRNTFHRMLVSGTRLVNDLISGYVPFYALHADKIPAMMRAGQLVNANFRQELFKHFASTQSGRLGGSRSVDYKESQSSSIAKSKFREARPGMLSNMVDLLAKNKLTDISGALSDMYYRVSDGPAMQIWNLKFAETFKANTGFDIDTEAFINDPNYKVDNKRAIEDAIRKADKAASNLFNTSASAEQKLDAQARKGTIWGRFNNFMRSFTYNENRVFWDSIYSLAGSGTMTRPEAFRNFMMVNVRGLSYSFLSMTVADMIVGTMSEMDDDEEDEVLTKALRRSVGQHGLLILTGNKGAGVNLMLGTMIELANRKYMEEEGDEYNPYQDNLVPAIPTDRVDVKQLVNMMGPEGYAIASMVESGQLSAKIVESLIRGEEITKEDLIEWKAARITASFISQSTGLPIDRSGRMLQKYLESE